MADEKDSKGGLDGLFASMKAAAAPEPGKKDDTDAILKGLLAPDRAPAPPADPLASLRATLGTPEEAEEPTLDDLLASLSGPVTTPEPEPVPSAAGLAEPPLDPDEGPSLDDLLASLEAPEPEPEPVPSAEAGALDDVLASLGAPEPEPSTEANALDDLLASLNAPEPEPEPSTEVGALDDLLATLDAPEPEPDPEPTAEADALDDLLVTLDAPEPEPEPEPSAEATALDDLLASLDAPEPAPPPAAVITLEPEVAAPSAAAPVPAPYSPDFGTLAAPAVARAQPGRGKFRIAILGDFSGRANRGALETGAALGARKPMKLDVDTLDTLIGRFRTKLTLPVGADGSAVEVEIDEIDDLHPDELYSEMELFSHLASLRAQVKSGAARALSDLKAWGVEHGDFAPAPRARTAGSVPADLRLSDFGALIGAKAAKPRPSEVDDLVARIVGPHVVAAPSADQPAMLKAVDAALSSAMRSVLHHPDFQRLESAWRTLDLLARRVETDEALELTVYDLAAEELAADLAASPELAASGLYDMLAERPAQDAEQGPFGAVIGLYQFEETPPHAELLGRMARIAAHIGAPFIASVSTGYLSVPAADRHPLVKQSWASLREMPEAKYLGLVTPRCLLRQPYGKRSDPIDSFGFEEFTPEEGMKGMPLANPALVVAILLAATVKQGGKAPQLGKIMSLDDMPFLYMTDQHGDQVALPCTERLLSARTAQDTVARGFMPLLSIKGQNVVRLGSFNAVGGGTLLGAWAEAPAGLNQKAAPAPTITMAVAVPEPEAPAEEVDLDALLADLGAPAEPAAAGDIDAELAALLGDL